MCTWKDIASAPTDGTWFIVYNGIEQHIVNQPKKHALGRWTRSGSNWFGSCTHMNPAPTHWCPCPPDPEK